MVFFVSALALAAPYFWVNRSIGSDSFFKFYALASLSRVAIFILMIVGFGMDRAAQVGCGALGAMLIELIFLLRSALGMQRRAV